MARVHICIDDASRIAVTDIFPDEKAVSAIAALRRAVAYYQSLGVTVTRVMPPSRQIALQSPVRQRTTGRAVRRKPSPQPAKTCT